MPMFCSATRDPAHRHTAYDVSTPSSHISELIKLSKNNLPDPVKNLRDDRKRNGPHFMIDREAPGTALASKLRALRSRPCHPYLATYTAQYCRGVQEISCASPSPCVI